MDKPHPFEFALVGVQQIDSHLQRGTRHYRNAEGHLLLDLYQVLATLEAGQLSTPTLRPPLPLGEGWGEGLKEAA